VVRFGSCRLMFSDGKSGSQSLVRLQVRCLQFSFVASLDHSAEADDEECTR
jgi:hypothetical protein